LNHTADLAIVAEAKTPEDLFTTFARAMFENMIEGRVEARFEKMITIGASDCGELLLDWLKELLFLFEVEGFIPVEYNLEITDNHLTAKVIGDRFDSDRHTASLEIKIPTYHQFQLEKGPDGYRGQIIFDV
jgi:SHS2 domain-containing protein